MAKRCSVYECKGEVVIELVGKPPPGPEPERTFGFCSEHGPIYASMGYTPAGGVFQAELTADLGGMID